MPVTTLPPGRQPCSDTLDGLDQQVGALAARLTAITAAEGNDASGEDYQPVPRTAVVETRRRPNARKP